MSAKFRLYCCVSAFFILHSSFLSAQTPYYHINRSFIPVEFDIEDTPTEYVLYAAATQLTDIVKGEAITIISNGTYGIEKETITIGYTNATGEPAWNEAIGALQEVQQHQGKICDNVGWIRGTKSVNGEWGAYLWTFQNRIAFHSSQTNWWTTDDGVPVAITNVFVGSLSNYPPMTDCVDIGPHLDGATNTYPGDNLSDAVTNQVDITNVYYQLVIPNILIAPREAAAGVNGSNVQFAVYGTNIPNGVTWTLYPTNFVGHAILQTNANWHYASVTPGNIATNYKVRATSVDNTNFYDEVNLVVVMVDMTAYRPTTEGTAYGNPFQKQAITNSQEENPGAGIRINGDDDNNNSTPDRNDTTVSGENDLIEVTLDAFPSASSGFKYVLKRSNSNIKVWNSQTKGTALLDANDETNLTFSTTPMTVWVENPNGGDADLELQAKTDYDTVGCSDKVHFYPFTSIVIALGGEDQVPTDPANANHGVFQLATNLYQQGYDVHMYDEDNVDYDGAGATYNEVVNAIQHRSVGQVAIFGYSHGGGSTYLLANLLNTNRDTIGTFTIPFTAYIDGVEDAFIGDMNQEHRRPPSSAYHVNYYQEGVANPLDPDFDYGLDGGPIDSPGADHEVDVDNPTPTETHYTVDDDATVLDGVESRLTPRVSR